MDVALWLSLGSLFAGCAISDSYLRGKIDVSTEAGTFNLEYPAGDDGARLLIEHALITVSPALTRWGGLNRPLQISVHPNHELFERAVNKYDYDWLRAWARYDEIAIQSPSTWTFFGASQREVNELVLHELTHCVMYQQSSTRETWRHKAFPIWFSEGMASYTSGQGYRWPSLEDVAVFINAHPETPPVSASRSLYQAHSDIVYAASHHAFTFLARRYGEPAIHEILETMARGETFPAAFSAVIGAPPETFVADFERYVRLRAFR